MLTNQLALTRASERIPGLRVSYQQTATHRVLATLRLIARSFGHDVIVLHEPCDVVAGLVCLFRLLFPFRRTRLVFVDALFSLPGRTRLARLRHAVKTILWREVDVFISYMKDVQPLEIHCRIPAAKCRYVPFKVNRADRLFAHAASFSEQGYVFTGGRSWRDFRTFCEAMKSLPYRGVLFSPSASERLAHGTPFDDRTIPGNVDWVLDYGDPQQWIQHLSQARLVVLCIRPDCLRPCGTANYLEAMALRKCVIITDATATRGILKDGENALIVPPADAQALAAVITRAMEDHRLRERIAERGYEYAMSLGSELDLMERVARAALS